MQFKRIISVIFLIILLTGCDRMKPTDFKKLQLPSTPNYYLICPENFCHVTPNEISPIYSVSVEMLQFAWLRMVEKEPRVTLIFSNPSEFKYQYIQRTRVFRFPDYIDVQFISLGKDKSTLALYSRARYGYYDFHVNQKRANRWLTLLTQSISVSPVS